MDGTRGYSAFLPAFGTEALPTTKNLPADGVSARPIERRRIDRGILATVRIWPRGRIHAGKHPQSAPYRIKREGRIEAVCQRHGRGWRRARPKGSAQGASGLRCPASKPARPCTAYPRLWPDRPPPASDEHHLMPVQARAGLNSGLNWPCAAVSARLCGMRRLDQAKPDPLPP